MTASVSNVQITATSVVLNDDKNGFAVEVKGLDNKLNCKRTFADPLKAMRYMFLLQKKLDLTINKIDLTAVSVAYQKAKEEMANATLAVAAIEDAANYQARSLEVEKSENPLKLEVDNTVSPIIKQFADLKKKHPDAMLLFRCGDFYEAYKEDAEKASEVLGITLTKRSADGLKMAGFPHHALDSYLPKLIRAGIRVAICDQISK